MSTTIKDIAERAEVSIATVSLVLNNKPGVGQTTRSRILKIADDLKYHQRGGVATVNRGTMRCSSWGARSSRHVPDDTSRQSYANSA